MKSSQKLNLSRHPQWLAAQIKIRWEVPVGDISSSTKDISFFVTDISFGPKDISFLLEDINGKI